MRRAGWGPDPRRADPGVATRVPSASGTRRRSAWAPPGAAASRCTQEDWYPARQISQVLSDAKNEPTTNWPGRIVVTPLPISSTMPAYSCPIGVGPFSFSMPRYGHRSEPQTQVATSRITASVGSTITGSGRSSTRTSPGDVMTATRMRVLLECELGGTVGLFGKIAGACPSSGDKAC